VNEKKVQAYIDLPKYEEILKEMNEKGRPPQVVSVTLPYSFAVIATIVTYLLHTFCGRKPILQVGTYKGEKANQSRLMETVLQYNADHTRLIKWLWNFLQDTQTYGLGVLRTAWRNDYRMRTKRSSIPQFNFFGIQFGSKPIATREKSLVYSGNDVCTIDPFMFFPDPNVPMSEVNRRGEFVVWRSFPGKHSLKDDEASGRYKWVDHANTQMPKMASGSTDSNGSDRTLRASGSTTPNGRSQESDVVHTYQEDQGTFVIIPRELGLGEATVPQKWLFTVLNKSQIVQAEPFDADHDMHPVCVAEPYSLGYGFGSLGMADYLGPIQDTLSWLINSRMHNVRVALNNMFVVDPSMVEMQDIRKPSAGRIIRLKRAAYGQDVNTVLKQLTVTDVTTSHTKDIELLMRIGQQLSAVTDNILGLQEAGGRKTATEVRTAGEAAASRLAAQARIISAQALVDLAEQMVTNIQQYIDENFYIMVVGEEGRTEPLRVGPDQLGGDFYFPIHDGTLPLDKIALLDVWKEIFIGVAKDPELRQAYSLPKMFEWIAELGGARNIESFKVNVAPNSVIESQLQNGQLAPIGAAPAPVAPGAGPLAVRSAVQGT
jgi:hypothetical protein